MSIVNRMPQKCVKSHMLETTRPLACRGPAHRTIRPQPACAASAALRIASSVAFGVIRLPS